MKKVLRIINRFNLGGPTYNAAYLTKYLGAEFETKLIGGVHQSHEESSLHITRQLGVEAHVIPAMQRTINLRGDIQAYREIRKIIRNFKPDIVHTHASKAGFLGRAAAFAESVPVVVHTFHGHVFHSYFPAWKTMLYKNIERVLAAKTDAVIAISPLQKRELTEIHRISGPEKTVVIRLGFELEKFRDTDGQKRKNFREKLGINEQTVVVGIIGRLVPVKNHRMFIDAIRLLKHRTKQPVLALIIGGGEEEIPLKRYAEAEGLSWSDQGSEADLFFTSWITAMEEVLPGIDIVALTSHNEGTPVSLIEAQAAGVPVVSTEVGGVRDVVDDGVTGIICPPADTAAFAEALAELAEHPDKRKILGAAGWDHVAGTFHVRRLATEVSALYSRLLRL